MRNALAVNEFREDATEKKREDKEGDKEARNLTDGSHHRDNRDDKEAVFIEEFAGREGNIVADESSHIACVALPRHEGSFEGLAPRMATNKQENNREGGANLEEEEAAAKKRDISREAFDKVGIDNVGED